MTEKVILGRLLCAQFVQTQSMKAIAIVQTGRIEFNKEKTKSPFFSTTHTNLLFTYNIFPFSHIYTYTHNLKSVCMSLHGVYCIENDMRKRDRNRTYCARSELYSEE